MVQEKERETGKTLEIKKERRRLESEEIPWSAMHQSDGEPGKERQRKKENSLSRSPREEREANAETAFTGNIVHLFHTIPCSCFSLSPPSLLPPPDIENSIPIPGS